MRDMVDWGDRSGGFVSPAAHLREGVCCEIIPDVAMVCVTDTKISPLILIWTAADSSRRTLQP